VDIQPDQVFRTALAGDPAPLTAAFAGGKPGQRVALLRQLLGAAEDAPVAACHALIWAGVSDGVDHALQGLMGWYLREEARGSLRARRAVHRDLVLEVLRRQAPPESEPGFDLGFAAVRVLTGLPVSLDQHAQAAAALRRLAGAWFGRDAPPPPRPAMIYAAIATMDLALIRRCVDAAGPDRPADLRHALEWGLNELMTAQGGPDAWLAAAIKAAHARDPESPGAVRGMLWLGILQDRHFREFVPMLRQMRLDRSEPQLRPALLFAHDKARQHEMPDEAAWLDAQLRVLDPEWSLDQGAIALDGADQAAPLRAEKAGDLTACLSRARDLANVDLRLGAALSPQGLAEAFRTLVAEIAAAPVPQDWTLARFPEAASSIRKLTTRQFGWVAHFVQAPHAGGRAEYGTVDLTFFPVLHHGLLTLCAAICRAGLAWVQAGHGAAGGWALARLIRTHTAAAIEADEIRASQTFLDQLDRAGVMQDVVAIARDDTRLRAGQLAEAAADPPLSRRGSSVHAFLPRPEWSRAEGLHWDCLSRDPALTGTFAIHWPDGQLRSYRHETPARDVLLTPSAEIALMAEGLLIGPKGHMLKPDPYHTSLNYPVESMTVLAGQGRAVRIRPRATRRHDAPVLLLDGLAVLHWPNYYHWMITHLARIALAADAGLLDQRQLVLPEGMKSWTHDSLDLIGVPEAQRLIVAPPELIRFADARILSSIEHLSPAAILSLRRRFLGQAAAVEAPPRPGRAFYLSRRSRALRKLMNEDEVEALAHAMGFEVIAPEDYTIAQQRALFAQARGIAAPEGAALSNMIFAAPGTRILSILCQNDMLPIFNDLALVLGQAHRKLPGTGIEGLQGSTRFQPHYRIAPDLARQALSWVLEGDR
jgi:hypothetical protein